MKISQSDVISNLMNTKADRFDQNKIKKSGNEGQTPDFKDIYESLATKTDVTYTNPAFDMNAMAVQSLMNENEDIQGSVMELVTDMLKRQGYTEEQIQKGEFGEIKVDEITQEKAKELIGPGGLLSPENVSDRIVNFSIAVFGGDTSKIDIIRSSINRGFAEAEKILGQLAEVSNETYELIQEKLDKWIEGEESEA